MILDELLAGFKDRHGDVWYLTALDKFLYLNFLRRSEPFLKMDETQEHLLLKKWVEDMVTIGIRTTEEQ